MHLKKIVHAAMTFGIMGLGMLMISAISAEENKISLSNFTANSSDGWKYNGGWEFPGSKGRILPPMDLISLLAGLNPYRNPNRPPPP